MTQASPNLNRYDGTIRAAKLLSAVILVWISGCDGSSRPKEPLPITPPGDAAGAAVTRTPIPEAPKPPPQATKPLAEITPPIVVPPGTQYVCVTDVAGERRQVAIEFTPKVAELCKKAPEMGPCQYERQGCRKSGGRVFAADGVEITMATEAEYDKRVMRIRLKSN